MGKEKKRGNTQTKKMTSIVRKLQWYMVRKKLMYYISADFLISCLLAVGWLLEWEFVQIGTISVSNHRKVIHLNNIQKWWYVIQDWVFETEMEPVTLLNELEFNPWNGYRVEH